MRVAFVVQRFGREIVGGAEMHAYQLTKKLREECGWNIDVYTTTARDYQTWKPHYRAGLEVSGGLNIRRFNCRIPRSPRLFSLYNFLVAPLLVCPPGNFRGSWVRRLCSPILEKLESLWFVLQGPWCPGLIAELISYQHRYKRVYFFTYLYYPTVRGLPELAHKSVLIPTAHDEAPLYFSAVQKMLNQAKDILVNSPAEGDLLRGILGKQSPRLQIAGIGISDFVSHEKAGPSVFPQKLPERYLCFLGRLSEGKGVSVLTDYFIRFCQERPDLDLHLVLAGPREKNFPGLRHKRIHYPGILDEAAKITLLSQALSVVNPSPRESLSLLVLESLALKKPVLVNGNNPVLKHYARENGSVIEFTDYAGFKKGVQYLLSASWTYRSQQELDGARNWVLTRYSWNNILKTFQNTMELTGD